MAPYAAAQSYNITNLGTLSGGTNSEAEAINASGQIVGYSESVSGSDDLNLDDTAFSYSSGVMSSLGTYSGGGNSYATSINTGGTIAGWAYNSSGFPNAFVYANGTMTSIGNLGGGESYAAGINDSGQIVGDSINSNNDDHAFLYAAGTMTDIGTLSGGIASDAFAINNGGTIVGVSYNSSGVAHAFSYSNGTMTDLGVPSGDQDSTAYAINSAGQIVGEADSASGAAHAFLYSNGTMTDLGVPAGEQNSYAYGINSGGTIVGTADDADGNYIAFVYANQTMTNLNGLISPTSGWTLEAANAINSSGDIVGYGLFDGNVDAFLLTPTVTLQTAVWGLAGGGSWATAGNWTGGFVPNSNGATAILGNSITAAATVTLDGSQTVAGLVFNSTNSYTLASGSNGTLTLNSSSGSPTVSDVNGSHFITAPIVLVGSAIFSVTNSTNVLQLSGNISGTGSLTDTGAGTLLLTAANTYTGPTIINANATLQVDTGSNTGSISSSSAITDNGIFIDGRTDNQTISAALSGTGIFQQNGVGTLTFTNATQYAGGFTINGGAVVLNTSLAASAGPVVMGATQNPNGPATTTSLGNLTINTNVTIGSLTSASNNSNADLLTIPSGVTLTDEGPFSIGALNDTSNGTVFTGSFTATGGGQLIVEGTFNAAEPSNNNGGKDTTTVNLSGLNAFSVNATSGTFNVGFGANTKGLLTLANTTVNSAAPTNTIDVGQVNVGNSNGGNDPGTSFLVLGSGTNTIDASNIIIGDSKTSGSVVFASSSSGSITIAGTGGAGMSNIIVGEATGGTEGDHTSGINLAGHLANINAGTVILGWEDGNAGSPGAGTLTFDTGTLNIQNLAMAVDSSGSSTTGAAGSLIVGASSSSGGTLNVGTSFVLASNTNTGASGPAIGTFTLNGGTANIDCNITVPSTTGTSTTTLTLAGGTLNMSGFAIGGPGAVNSGNGPVSSVVLPASGHQATLANLGETGINGGGLTMNGAGTLVLTGDNTYSGTTTVSNGLLMLASSTALPANSAVTDNATVLVDAAGSAAQITGSGNLIVDGRLQLTGSGLTSQQHSLTVNSATQLDLTSNTFLITYAGSADPIAAIASYLQTGCAGGAWNGDGIVSSTVASEDASQSQLLYSVGYADGADGLTGLSSGQIEILPTLAGDAKLEGTVNFGDFQLLAEYFGQSGTSWDQGDFTYSGTVTFGDFQLLAQDFGSGNSAVTAGELASLNQFAAESGEELAANSDGVGFRLVSVPEPASVGLMAMTALGVFARRKRRRG